MATAASDSADEAATLADLGKFIGKYATGRRHQQTDPYHLPFRAPDAKTREPYTSNEEFQASLFQPKYQSMLLASLGTDGIKLTQATLPAVPVAADTAAVGTYLPHWRWCFWW